MTLTLELTREEETVLQRQAQMQGVDVDTLVRACLVGNSTSPSQPSQHPGLAALLNSWFVEGANTAPEEARRAEAEAEELLQALQHNRVDFCEGLIPDNYEV